MTPKQHDPRRIAWVAGLGLLVLVGGAVWLRQPQGQRPKPHTPINLQSADGNISPPSMGLASSRTNPPGGPSTSVASPSRTRAALRLLQTAPDAATARERLEDLRTAFSAMPTDVAVPLIRQFLDTKADAPTRLGFKLALNGVLEETPTVRTFLLDEMARLDRAAAAAYARVILDTKDSADEWAVALRNLARGDASIEERALLEQKTEELLRHEPWQSEPAVGFLEAFDVAVYLGGTHLVPTLSELIRRQDNLAVAHAAFLALDRLIIKDPTGVLAVLQAEPDWMLGREQTRANYFARADVRDSNQRQLLENYLTNPQLSPSELEGFAGVYPNANFMISPNLLTPTPIPNREVLTSLDEESLRVVQEWLSDPRFANLRPALEKVRLRLEEFVGQAKPRN